MENILMMSTDRDLFSNPIKLARFIIETAKAAEVDESSISKIMGFEMLRESLRSCGVEKEDNARLNYLTIVQCLVIGHVNNHHHLGRILEEITTLSKNSRDAGLKASPYLNLAREFIRQLYDSARSIRSRIDANSDRLQGIRSELIKKSQLDQEQSRIIAEIKRLVDLKFEIDMTQSEAIDKLSLDYERHLQIEDEQFKKIDEIDTQLQEKNQIDDLQSKLLAKLKEQLIEIHVSNVEKDKILNHMESVLSRMQDRMDELEAKVSNLKDVAVSNDMKMEACGKRLQKAVILHVAVSLVLLGYVIFVFAR